MARVCCQAYGNVQPATTKSEDALRGHPLIETRRTYRGSARSSNQVNTGMMMQVNTGAVLRSGHLQMGAPRPRAGTRFPSLRRAKAF